MDISELTGLSDADFEGVAAGDDAPRSAPAPKPAARAARAPPPRARVHPVENAENHAEPSSFPPAEGDYDFEGSEGLVAAIVQALRGRRADVAPSTPRAGAGFAVVPAPPALVALNQQAEAAFGAWFAEESDAMRDETRR